MRRTSLLLVSLVILGGVSATPAMAVHDQYEAESLLIPWQHDGGHFATQVGVPFEVGARWGACTEDLANDFLLLNLSGPTLSVEDTTATWPAGSWEAAVNPSGPVSSAPLEDCEGGSEVDTGWWTYWSTSITFHTPGQYDVTLALSTTDTTWDGLYEFDGFSVAGTIIVDVAPSDVSGTVRLDGVPLAGVEVFMGDGTARYTCTDSSGYYFFTDVDAFGFMATGPEVHPSIPCSNSKFVDAEGTPLLVAIRGEGGQAPATGIDFAVERLPDENRGFYQQLKTALNNCYDGDGSSTADILGGFAERVERALDKKDPKVTEDAVEKYLSYAETLAFIAGTVCPQP